MIPDFGLGNVLPPFLGDDAVGAYLPRSPYEATISEFVERFATSPERGAILRGLLRFRRELRDAGFSAGIQWIDGSFVENCETVKGRAPGDVDVVSLLYRPAGCEAEADWDAFLAAHAETIFSHNLVKDEWRCDSYFVDLSAEPRIIAELSAYWFGLFSHQRDTFRWKGLVQLEFLCDDDEAAELLTARELTW